MLQQNKEFYGKPRLMLVMVLDGKFYTTYEEKGDYVVSFQKN